MNFKHGRDMDVIVASELLEKRSKILKKHFDARLRYPVFEADIKYFILLLCYLKYNLIPRSDEISEKFWEHTVRFEMVELQRIVLGILHPIQVRLMRNGFAHVFEQFQLPPEMYSATMFDLCTPNGRFQKGASFSAMAITSMAALVSGSSQTLNKASKCIYGQMLTTILLPAEIMFYIMGIINPPQVPSLPRTGTGYLRHKGPHVSADGRCIELLSEASDEISSDSPSDRNCGFLYRRMAPLRNDLPFTIIRDSRMYIESSSDSDSQKSERLIMLDSFIEQRRSNRRNKKKNKSKKKTLHGIEGKLHIIALTCRIINCLFQNRMPIQISDKHDLIRWFFF